MTRGQKETDFDDWKKAGQITAECLEFGRKLIKPGIKLLEVAEKIEAKIREMGAKPAFPVNISMNEIAAHYTPSKDDETIFKDQLVKLDIGAVFNGAIGDSACTIDLSGGRFTSLVQASIDALNAAIKVCRPGTQLKEIGAEIEKAISSHGFKPIRNLSGHQLEKYTLHAGLTTPNFDNNDETELEEGMFLAIEPFATDGAGLIQETQNPQIFLQLAGARVRTPFARNVLKEIEGFEGLPFAKRWLKAKGAEFGLREIQQSRALHEYTPLSEVNKGMVSQAEHTLFIDSDGAVVLTKK
jgi:methionyl aminopeptidase